ncbi:MAG TPA: hypothetical protein VFN56_05030 [Candidatus Saccharimonadales bacterium]|nr:hypothetical protein [Candidatus Saccharimonadales bacterium]
MTKQPYNPLNLTKQQLRRNRMIGVGLIILFMTAVIYNQPWYLLSVISIYFIVWMTVAFFAWRRTRLSKYLLGMGNGIVLFGLIYTIAYVEKYKHAHLMSYALPAWFFAICLILIFSRFKRVRLSSK